MRRRLSIPVALVALLAPIVVAVIMAAPALGDEYQYTVRVFPGNRGTLPADPVVASVPKGGSVNLYDIATATITDDKYVQTGFRLSGTDKLIGGNGQINGISEDMDFVVAYGVEANTVPYTLKYVEYQTGKELAESKTYYGKAGEKPVAAYEYIEGYRPRYLAITGTLRAGEENVWTFEYVPLAEGETIVQTTTTTNTVVNTVPGNTTTTVYTDDGSTGTASNGGTTTEGGTAGGTTTDGGTAGTTTAAGGAGATTEGGAPGAAAEPPTQEILDLDTPLAGPDASNAAGKIGKDASILTSPAIIAAIVVVAAAAAGLIVFLAKLKKDKADEKEA